MSNDMVKKHSRTKENPMAGTLNLTAPAANVLLSPTVDVARQKFVYDESTKKSSNVPELDAKGRAIFTFTAGVSLNGQRIGEVRVSGPSELPTDLDFSEALVATGDDVVLSIRNQKNDFNLGISMTIDGLEKRSAAPAGRRNLPGQE